MPDQLTRRDFLVTVSAAVGLAFIGEAIPAAAQPRAGGVVLFQGDSITDASRNRTVLEPNVARALGTGYPLLVASDVLRDKPERGYRFITRHQRNKFPISRSGGRETRWHQPDVLSILIGVNDYWHHLLNGYPGP